MIEITGYLTKVSEFNSKSGEKFPQITIFSPGSETLIRLTAPKGSQFSTLDALGFCQVRVIASYFMTRAGYPVWRAESLEVVS